jgi:hypothetical protein
LLGGIALVKFDFNFTGLQINVNYKSQESQPRRKPPVAVDQPKHKQPGNDVSPQTNDAILKKYVEKPRDFSNREKNARWQECLRDRKVYCNIDNILRKEGWQCIFPSETVQKLAMAECDPLLR